MARPPRIRPARVASLVREVLAELVTFEIKDPRVAGLSISEVEVTGDLREAKVFVCGAAGEEAAEEALRALRGASGFLRRELGQRIKLRVTPELRFVYDASLEYGARIEARLRELGLGAPAAPEGEPEGDGAAEDHAADDGPED